MAKTTLSRAQEKFLKLFSQSPLAKQFYLTGGTALAEFYLRHRKSEDLDFFTEDSVDPQEVRAFLAERIIPVLKTRKVMPSHKYDRWIFELLLPKRKVLKIEFTRYPYRRLGKRRVRSGIIIDSLLDIAANKVVAMLDRFEPKDYVDLYFILSERLSWRTVKNAAERKFSYKIDPAVIGPVLMRAKDLPILPRLMRTAHRTDVQDFFYSLARRIGRPLFY